MTLPGPNFGLKSAVVCAASEAALQDGNGASRAATSDAPWPADGVSVGSGRGGEPEGVFRARDAREPREPRVLRDGEDAGAAEVAAPKVTPVATGKVAPTPTQSGGGTSRCDLGVAAHGGPRGDSGMFPVGVGGAD